MFKLFERPQKPVDENPPTQGIGAVGTLTVKLYDKNGNLKGVRGPMRNLIVQIGKSYICNQLGSSSKSAGAGIGYTKKGTRWTGIGHSSTAAASTQTKLLSQRARRKNTFTFTSGRGYYSCIATFITFGPGGSFSGKRKATIYESGIFWGSQTTDKVMMARQTFAAVSKLSADTLTVEWRVSVS